jgi:glutaryl-CoA dehydrogenase
MSSEPIAPLDLILADSLLSEEERAIRETVRTYLEAEVAPHISAWFEAGELPVHEVAAGLGQLGLLGCTSTGMDVRA